MKCPKNVIFNPRIEAMKAKQAAEAAAAKAEAEKAAAEAPKTEEAPKAE